jgi:hypothetical protein
VQGNIVTFGHSNSIRAVRWCSSSRPAGRHREDFRHVPNQQRLSFVFNVPEKVKALKLLFLQAPFQFFGGLLRLT